jgi:hypothetical protein
MSVHLSHPFRTSDPLHTPNMTTLKVPDDRSSGKFYISSNNSFNKAQFIWYYL